MNDGVSSQSLRDFNQALREYLQYNKREAGPLIENRAKKVQWELYRQFKAIAATPDKIEAEAKARGYPSPPAVKRCSQFTRALRRVRLHPRNKCGAGCGYLVPAGSSATDPAGQSAANGVASLPYPIPSTGQRRHLE